jgi:hypothetical protein
VKKLLLASVLAIASFPGYAVAANPDDGTVTCHDFMGEELERCAACVDQVGRDLAAIDRCMRRTQSTPSARVVTVTPYQGCPPIGWVYAPYTICGDPPRCSTGVVNVPADGLNVRMTPNGYPVLSLVNGTPLIPFQKQGDWLLVAPACDLTPTWAWSWNAGVPLNRCWVYF